MQYEAKKSNQYKEGQHSWYMDINRQREREMKMEQKLELPNNYYHQGLIIINSTSKWIQ